MSELKIFERLTLLFSETKVPLIHQVVPALWKLRDRLQATVDRPAPKLHPLLRVAAQASIKVFDKYMRLFEESSLYWVALVMCPHKKLEWLRSRGYSESDIQRIEALVYSAFDKMTSNWSESSSEKVHSEDSMISQFNQSLADGWLSDDEIEYARPSASQDTLEFYLRTPLVPVEVLRQGGLLAYWHGQQKVMPRVSKFALGILSSPASSVDAERAFSGGRLTIGHLQHSMGDTTFEAKMAVGSWFDTPLLPSVDVADTIVKERGRN
ncbi:hypothetical protein FRC12_020948 [Ceratobasidium sp. 428]|nr:hypothetical protein FRC12_020948 [Ceratobasidium sp. 428]